MRKPRCNLEKDGDAIMERGFINKGNWGTCLWAIDEAGTLFISYGVAEDIAVSGIPWSEHRNDITEITVVGEVSFPSNASLAGLFKGCTYLEKAELTGFNTENVVDMSSMFEGCTLLSYLDLSSFDTSNCKKMDRMFAKCGHLNDIVLGSKFYTEGDGTASIGNKLAIKNAASKFRHAKVIITEGSIVTYCENVGRDVKVKRTTVHDYKYTIEENMFESPISTVTSAECKFASWNTLPDGSGITLMPGDELTSVDADISFYAIWSDVPTIGKLRPIPEFTYGETIPFGSTSIQSDSSPITGASIELSPTGEEGTWKEISRKTILSAGCSGWMVRFCAENLAGKSYSNPVELHIRKATIDMSGATWAGETYHTYDGSEKRVWVEGIPEGVTAKYTGNIATNVGVYTATCEYEYDSVNYEKPQPISPHIWEIGKAALDPSELEWSSYQDFVYDGKPHSVRITNLPVGATVTYEGAEEVTAGKYLAVAKVEGNYSEARPIKYEWEISKASYDMSRAWWNYYGAFEYDKTTHEVTLSGFPQALKVEYTGNFGINAGDYEAVASFINPDTHNWYTPDDIVLNWSIAKREIDMSRVRWAYEEPFIYDGSIKKIELCNLPEGVYAEYENASASNAGIYNARASLKFDSDNLTAKQPADCQWKICKERIDVSDVAWDYGDAFTYDGKEHTVSLVNLPTTLIAEYRDNVKVEAGKYAASVTLTPLDSLNYERPNVNACTWSINKATIPKKGFEWTDTSEFVYDGAEKSVEITSDIGDNLDVMYISNKAVNAGRYFTKAIFAAVDDRNFKAPDPIGYSWRIAKADYDLSSVSWDYVQPFTYDGSEQGVRLINVPEGIAVSYTNASATDAGEYTATAKLSVIDDKNYNSNIPDMSIDWKIERAKYDLQGVKWQDVRDFTYDEESKEVRLVGLPHDLTPIYSGNVATLASEYVASADFDYDKRNYVKPEVPTCRWRISKAVVDMSAVRWNYEEPFTYDGEEKVVELLGAPAGSYVTYTNSAAVEADTYIASATVVPEDMENYLPCKAENLTWRIRKGDYDMSRTYWDYEKPFTYDGTDQGIILMRLPDGLTPIYRGNFATNAGTYRASVSFKIDDEKNYKVPTFPDCEWCIEKADFDMSVAQWDYSTEFKYNGRIHEVFLRGLPEGVTAVYSGNAELETGTYVASAELVPYDRDNYNKPSVQNCVWEIARADMDMSGVKWDSAESRVYNGRAQSVMLEQLPNGLLTNYIDNEATEVGQYTAKAVLSVADPKNYNTPSVRSFDWEIVPAEYDMSGAKWKFTPGCFIYDGTRKSVEIEGLPESVIASYEANSAVQAGDYTAVATFETSDSNYKAPKSESFGWRIDKADADMSRVAWDYSSEFVYDGIPKRVELTGLPTCVRAEYENNCATDAGDYTAVARFITDETNYNTPEPIQLEWSISRANADIARTRWDYSQAFVYDGSTKGITIEGLPVYMGASYSNNEAVEAGRYLAHADLFMEGPANYNIPTESECEWEILRADYDMSDVRWEGDFESVYDGYEKGLRLIGLPEGVQPIYSNARAFNAGEYLASVDFTYDSVNYNRPHFPSQKWRISKTSYDMSGAHWDYDADFVYDGGDKTVSLVGLPLGVQPIYAGNTAAATGEYEARASFSYDEVNYEMPSFGACKWEIKMADAPIDASQISWNYSAPFIYDGTPKSVVLSEKTVAPSFIEKLRGKQAEVFLEGVPEGFEVVYENNEAVEAGVYYATAKLISTADSNYRDFIVPECRWEIAKADIDISDIDWDYERAFTYDGLPKSVRLKNLPDTVKVSYTNCEATNAGDYEALAVLETIDPANYEAPRPVKACWWTIKKASYDMSGARWTGSDNLVYSGTEHTVTVEGLPEGVSVSSYRGNMAIEAGSYIAEVSLDYENKFNYEAPQMPELGWRILKKSIDTSNARWNYDPSTLFIYDGKVKEVKLYGVPEGVEVVYIDNAKINAGTYIARAKLSYDIRNYEAKDIPDLSWTINRANFETADVHWTYDEPFTYDGYEKSIFLSRVPDSIDVRYRDNKATGIGSYTAKAYLTYDSGNYNPPAIPTTIDWEIIKEA